MFLVSDAIYMDSTTLKEWLSSHDPSELRDFMWKSVFVRGWNGLAWTQKTIPKYPGDISAFKLILHYKGESYTFGKGTHGKKEIHFHIVDSMNLP